MRLAPTAVVFRLNKAAAKINQQLLEAVFFDALGVVVCRPVLFVGRLFLGDGHAARQRFAAVEITLALNRELDGVNVFAFALSRLEIRASASRAFAVKDDVFAVAALARDFPLAVLATQFA